MYVKYGTFQHADNLTSFGLTRSFRINPRNGRRMSEVRTVRMSGYVLGSTQAAIKLKIDELQNEYAQDGKNWALYHDDGTISSHSLVADGSMLSPVHVTEFSFPDSDNAEYATQRRYSITLEAEYLVSGNQLIEFSETVSIQGNGGPNSIVTPLILGIAVVDQTSNFTAVQARQSGTAVGFLTYPSIPPPIWPYPILKNPSAGEDRTSPQVTGGIPNHYPVSWSYSFESPTPLFALPSSGPIVGLPT